jgi:hypothetical protein
MSPLPAMGSAMTPKAVSRLRLRQRGRVAVDEVWEASQHEQRTGQRRDTETSSPPTSEGAKTDTTSSLWRASREGSGSTVLAGLQC